MVEDGEFGFRNGDCLDCGFGIISILDCFDWGFRIADVGLKLGKTTYF